MKLNLIAATLLAAVLVSACAAGRPAPAPATAIPVEIRPTAALTVVQAQAVRQGGTVLVRGTLKRPHPVDLPGHVDVLFVAADGTPLREHTIRVPGAESRRGDVQEIPFAADFPLQLPAGARAILTYHAPPF